jgi:hypothetical protein
MFEELEQRIVLDASVDSIAVGSHAGGPDLFHGLQAEPGHVGPAVNASAHHGGDWTLEYSSEPGSKMAQVIDHHDLALIDVELGSPLPGITLYAVQPVTDASIAADLSGAIRVTGDPTLELTMTLTPNPRPVNSYGIDTLSTTTITGHADDINATLATLYATINSCFNGFAEIDISLSDPDHSTNSDDSPLAVTTLYIPVDQTPHTPSVMVPGPQNNIPSDVAVPIPISLADKDSNELSVFIKANHGIVTVPSAGADVEGLVHPPVLYYETLGADGRALDHGVRVNVKGPISNLNGALAGATYQSFPGYQGQDQVTVTVSDERFPRQGSVCSIPAIGVIPITVA